MDKVARLSMQERSELFALTAEHHGFHPAIAEKDFWVCWVLRKIFRDDKLSGQMIFKGGTSLSKVYGLINRFSEDIDLVLDWRLLGYAEGDESLWGDGLSNTQKDRLNEEVNAAAKRYLVEVMQPRLAELFAADTDVSAVVSEEEVLTIEIHYPAAFAIEAIRPQVKLEIGPLASRVPHQEAVIRPYAAEAFPDVFESPECPVVAIRAERTFWEKATILHQQAHRKNSMPIRYSRHYYDIYQLAGSEIKESALGDLAMLREVVRFKQRFYRSSWASYETAMPGTLRLLPKVEHIKELAQDYASMRAMIFGEIPAWDEIQAGLRQLEQEINALADPPG